jgi:hypothetical protein
MTKGAFFFSATTMDLASSAGGQSSHQLILSETSHQLDAAWLSQFRESEKHELATAGPRPGHTMQHPSPLLLDGALPPSLFEELRDVVSMTRETPRRFWVSSVEPKERRLRTPVVFAEQVVQYVYAMVLPPEEDVDLMGVEYWIETRTEAEVSFVEKSMADPVYARARATVTPVLSVALFINRYGYPMLVDGAAFGRGGALVLPEPNRAVIFPGNFRFGHLDREVCKTYAGLGECDINTDVVGAIMYMNFWATLPHPSRELERGTPIYAGEVYPSMDWMSSPPLRMARMPQFSRTDVLEARDAQRARVQQEEAKKQQQQQQQQMQMQMPMPMQHHQRGGHPQHPPREDPADRARFEAEKRAREARAWESLILNKQIEERAKHRLWLLHQHQQRR